MSGLECFHFIFTSISLSLLAVDQTRCHLQPLEIDGHDHDYINANFIDVSECEIEKSKSTNARFSGSESVMMITVYCLISYP